MRRSLALPAWLLVPVLVLPLVTAKSRAQAAELPGAAERRAALQAMSDAFRAEDLTAALALDAPGLQVVERPQLTAMFRDLNYLRLEQRVLSERALPDGAIEMDVVSTLSSRHVDESADRREKRRWIYVMERGPRGLVIRESHPARIPEIPLDATWDPVSWSGRVTLSPDARRDSGRVEVVLEAVVRNGGVFASRRVGFGLQPFAEGLTVRSGGAGLATSRNESAMDAWMVELPAPVPPGGEVALDMTYAFDQDGAPGAASFGRSGARLFSASGWHPLFRPSRADLPVLASHDLVIDVPAGWTGLAPGRKGPAPAKVSGRAVTRWISEFPGPELAVVAGPFKSMPVPLAGGRRLDVLALAARPAPSAGVRDEAAAAFAWLQHALGPSPLAGFTLVEMPGPAAGAQGMLVLPDLAAQGGIDADKESVPVFEIAHNLAHGWIIDSVGPTGPGAAAVAEGLCDALAAQWFEGAVDAKRAENWREDVIDVLLQDSSLDQPIVSSEPAAVEADIFGPGKAMLVFGMFRDLAGDGALEAAIKAWRSARVRSTDGRTGTPVEGLLAAMAAGEPVRAAFVETWFRQQGTAEVLVSGVTTRELTPEEARAKGLDPGAWKHVTVTIANHGIGPAPVRVDLALDRRHEKRVVVVPEGGAADIELEAGQPPQLVWLDPDHRLWESQPEDDVWPARPGGSRPKRFGLRAAGSEAAPKPSGADPERPAPRKR